MELLGPALFLPVALAATFAGVFIHELGHALVGRLFGYVPTSFGLGIARPLLVVPIRGTRVYFCRSRPLTGLAISIHRTGSPTRLQTIGFMAGGGLFNAALAAACLMGARFGPGHPGVWLIIGLVNLAFAATSFIPMRFNVGKAVMVSDGGQILQVIRSGHPDANPVTTVQSSAVIQGLASAVGDRSLGYVSLLSTSDAWIDLEDLERAERDA